MPTRSSYEHGVPSWIDLASTDADASKTFYGRLFGWTFEPYADDPNNAYLLATLDGRRVAGLMQMPPEMAAGGIPSTWTTYIAVDDLDATVAKVEGAGGKVISAPMRVSAAGSMAIIADPAGATVGLWHGDEHIGAGLVNEHGTLSWNELQTPDPATAAAFYGAVLGWSADTVDMGPAGDYTVFHLGDGKGIAGASEPPMPGVPTHWSTVLATDDADRTATTAKALGGAVMVEPFDIAEVGRIAVVADPTGAVFQAIQMTAAS